MSNELRSWPRPHFEPGGGRPFILFHVFGAFSRELAPSRARHRVGGIPEGLQVTVSKTDDESVASFLSGAFAEQLDADATLGAAVRAAPEVMLFHGELSAQPTLDYLRDAVGLVAAALDVGGVGVLDAQRLAWWSPETFRATFVEVDEPAIHEHTVILASDEEQGEGMWLHTRGMRKFGRPDLSVRNVPAKHRDGAVLLVQRLIESMALGAIVPEGQPIKMAKLPAGLSCHHAGDLDDPEFNNVHVEIRFGARSR
jgi:hypothetical protein